MEERYRVTGKCEARGAGIACRAKVDQGERGRGDKPVLRVSATFTDDAVAEIDVVESAEDVERRTKF